MIEVAELDETATGIPGVTRHTVSDELIFHYRSCESYAARTEAPPVSSSTPGQRTVAYRATARGGRTVSVQLEIVESAILGPLLLAHVGYAFLSDKYNFVRKVGRKVASDRRVTVDSRFSEVVMLGRLEDLPEVRYTKYGRPYVSANLYETFKALSQRKNPNASVWL